MDQKEFKKCDARNDTLVLSRYYRFHTLALAVILWEVAAEYFLCQVPLRLYDIFWKVQGLFCNRHLFYITKSTWDNSCLISISNYSLILKLQFFNKRKLYKSKFHSPIAVVIQAYSNMYYKICIFIDKIV